ncbi:hypothetical protein HD806DRAFT_530113 [Xylariaceae sp. AK1471]|nr:hypothetical protein HD806DRAFT_530113 [Xylariaceae sp. AK1471]
MSSTSTTSSRPSSPSPSPVLRRLATGCAVTLGAGLVPSSITHGSKCKCIAVRTDEEISRLGESVKTALEEGILESEKPALAFAMILLGVDRLEGGHRLKQDFTGFAKS